MFFSVLYYVQYYNLYNKYYVFFVRLVAKQFYVWGVNIHYQYLPMRFVVYEVSRVQDLSGRLTYGSCFI